MVLLFGFGPGKAEDLGEVAPIVCPNCHNEVFLHYVRSKKAVRLYFVPVVGRFGVPGSASAVVLNLTSVNARAAGYATAYPDGITRPLASDLNYSPGQAIPNLVVVQVGADGKVALFNGSATGSVDLVADLVGWFS